MFKTIIKNCCLISVFLITGCNGASADSSQESSIEKQLSESTSFEDTKKLLLDYLTEDNVEEVNELAINYGIYKPMYSEYYLPTSSGERKYFRTYAYGLNSYRGNAAYREALDNLYFRKTIFALFKHEDYELTSSKSKEVHKNPNCYKPTYKFSPSSKEIILNEGIEEAKSLYHKAVETGIKNNTTKQLYLKSENASELVYEKRDLFTTSFTRVMGSSIRFSYVSANIDLDQTTKKVSGILTSYVPFYTEIILDNYDMYNTLKSILSDFVYSEDNPICTQYNDCMNNLINCDVRTSYV